MNFFEYLVGFGNSSARIGDRNTNPLRRIIAAPAFPQISQNRYFA